MLYYDYVTENTNKLAKYKKNLYIVQFYVHVLVLWLFNWNYESVSPNRKLNLITWWICFSFKKVDRRSAMIHVFTKTPPTQGSRKVARFMQNEPQFIVYRAQRTNVNIKLCPINLPPNISVNINFNTSIYLTSLVAYCQCDVTKWQRLHVYIVLRK